MAADHEKEEDEGWTRGLMQDFQAAGQKYRSIKLRQTHAQSLIRFIFSLSTEFGHRLLLILDILLTNSHGF